KIMGRVVTLLLLGLFLVLSAVEVKLYGELLTTAFLTETPQIVFLFLIVLLAVVCVFLGVEVLGRMADIIMGVFIIMFAGIFFISLRYIDLQNLQPIFVRGWSPVLSGSIIPIALVSQSWVIGMLNVTTVNEEKSFWVPITSIGSSLILLIIIAIVVVGVIGPHEGARSVFPIFTLMRSVVLTQFLQRTESLVVFGWGMGLFIYVSTYLYSGASGLARWLNLDDYRPLLPLMGVIWVIVVHYRFKTIFVLQWLLSPEIFGRIGILILIIPLFFLWLALGLKNEQKGG
ncbi:MAG: GerAB/ArcD/ProY family transporter, partial [Halanaerobiaceae bacterium]